MRVIGLILLLLFSLIGFVFADQNLNCNNATTVFVPLTDLGLGTYQGYTGGLYPNESNTRPAIHNAAGISIASTQIVPLNALGQYHSSSGKIVFISIGMSNASMEFSNFTVLFNGYSQRNPKLYVMDGAVYGQTAPMVADEISSFGSTVTGRLAQYGFSTNQVQVAWLKEAIANPSTTLSNSTFPSDATTLQGYLHTIPQVLKKKFPNVKLCYNASRTYAGYAGVSSILNPEPYAYQSGFAVKWLIAQQINGDSTLNYDSTHGVVNSPWLVWGPYLWANGTAGRSDGFIWNCIDVLSTDGTHPSTTTGRPKIAQLLLDFFSIDSTAVPWFKAPVIINHWEHYGDAVLPVRKSH